MKGQTAPLALEDIHRAFTDVPRSSEQILHPEKYWDAEKRDDPVVVRFLDRGLTGGWEVLHENTFGEFTLNLLVQPSKKRKGMSALSALMTKYTSPEAEGWGGDRYVLLGKGDARVVALHTEWDTVEDAAEFAEAWEEIGEYVGGSASRFAELREARGAGQRMRREGTSVVCEVWAGVDAVDEVLAGVGFVVEM